MGTRLIVFVSIAGGLWILLGMPGGEFLSQAWLVAALWLALLVMAVFPGESARELGVDVGVYGPLVPALGFTIPLVGVVIGAAILTAARFGGDWIQSVALGLPGVLLLGFVLAACLGLFLLLQRSTLGDSGSLPISDSRPNLQSTPRPPQSDAEISRPAPPSVPSERPGRNS